MNFFEKLLVVLDFDMIEPTMYGWFHLMFLGIMIFLIVLIKKKYSNLSVKQIKKVLLIYAILCLTLEVYKQLNFSFNYDEVSTWWSYKWYAFPFQFCSVPMYVALIAALTRNKKVEKATFAFLGTYSLIAGLSCMVYPDTVFVTTIGINIQTMIHHGSMVVIGFFLLMNKQVKYNLKSLFNASVVFYICVFCALLMDIVTYYIGIDGGLKMFFISPFYQSSLPVFSIIYDKVPYFMFLLIYLLLFSIGAFLVLKVSQLCTACYNRLQKLSYKEDISN